MVALSEITGCILGLAAEAGGTPVAPISPRTKYFIRIAVVAHDATGDGDGGEISGELHTAKSATLDALEQRVESVDTTDYKCAYERGKQISNMEASSFLYGYGKLIQIILDDRFEGEDSLSAL
eukprot:scaffold46940_cov32-Tisochrysis_lutea.AAC.3